MSAEQKIWHKIISRRVFFIAEIGKNFIQTKIEASPRHYLKNAMALVKAAKEAGADAVKFQTHWVDDEQLPINVMSPHFDGADRYSWVSRNTKLTPLKFWHQIKKYCDEIGITFFSTPMSRGAAKILARIDVPMWKIGSGDTTDFVMLDYMRHSRLPIIISSGMSTLKEIDDALTYLRQENDRLALMHCISKYPCPPRALNLHLIRYFKRRYQIPIGFSDHSLGFEAALQAVNLGAIIIEKHFSSSRSHWGSDHKVSMLPDEYAYLVQRVRQGKTRIQNPKKYYIQRSVKELPDHASKFRPYFRKTLVASRLIKPGTKISESMIYAMRPQGLVPGLPSEQYPHLVNKKAARLIKPYEAFQKTDLL